MLRLKNDLPLKIMLLVINYLTHDVYMNHYTMWHATSDRIMIKFKLYMFSEQYMFGLYEEVLSLQKQYICIFA